MYTDAVVIDLGSHSSKICFSGEDSPRSEVSTTLYKSLEHEDKTYIGKVDGEERATASYPVKHGKVVDWDALNDYIFHLFWDELQISPQEQAVLLTGSILYSREAREELAKCMFESLQVRGLFMAIPAVLSLFSSGRTTGIVVEIGDGSTKVVPIFEGHGISYAIRSLNVSGDDLSKYMKELLESKGYSFEGQGGNSKDIVEDIKHKTCSVATNKRQLTSTSKTEFELPDGTLIHIGNERHLCPEALFDPGHIDKECAGVHKAIVDSIEKCDGSLHADLYENVLLAGGTTLIPNLTQRIQSEVKDLTLPETCVQVAALHDRKHAAVIGGSLLASMPVFEKMMVTKEMYAEKPHTVHSRFL